jgi:4-hydroxybenzoate polyprenyltransferase
MPARYRVGIAKARSEARVVEQRKLTKGRAALLLILSALGATVSATMLDGWHVYLGFAAVGVGLFFGFIRWNRKN